MIITCNCDNGGDAVKYQKAKYGQSKRVGTGPYSRGLNKYSHCTICGKEHMLTSEKEKKKK